MPETPEQRAQRLRRVQESVAAHSQELRDGQWGLAAYAPEKAHSRRAEDIARDLTKGLEISFQGHPPEQDPNGLPPTAPGAKLDQGKPISGEVILGFPNALHALVTVATFGAAKYSRHGFLAVPQGEQRYLDALMRHLIAWGRGEATDADSGLPHTWHALWNMAAVVELAERSAAAGQHSAAPDAVPENGKGVEATAGKPAAAEPTIYDEAAARGEGLIKAARQGGSLTGAPPVFWQPQGAN